MYDRDKIIAILTEIRDESQTIAPYVIIAQPRRNKAETPAQSFDGHGLTHIDLMGYSHGFVDIDGEKVDVARNFLIDACLSVPEAKYMFFIGEDTVVPWDAFLKLHETAEANPGSIVTGVYYMKMSNAMIMVRENNIIKIPDISPEPRKIIDAWQTGMDCMLIPLDLLREMQAKEPDIPWACVANEVHGFPFVGEDNFFVHRIHKHGIRLLVDTSVQCLHMDLATGKYTAHPDVDLNDYYTNIKPTERLTLKDKKLMDERWISRIPKGSENNYAKLFQKMVDEGVPIRLNMGSGRDRLDGFLGVDRFTPEADIKEDIFDLVLPDGSIDEILASHILEHLLHTKVPALLESWYNSLIEGGRIVIECPDIEAIAKAFAKQDDLERYTSIMAIYGISGNNVTEERVKDGTESIHYWGYYPKSLKDLLVMAGFNEDDIVQEKPQGIHPGHNFRLVATKRSIS